MRQMPADAVSIDLNADRFSADRAAKQRIARRPMVGHLKILLRAVVPQGYQTALTQRAKLDRMLLAVHPDHPARNAVGRGRAAAVR